MARPQVMVWTVVLLLGGGVAFALVGFRALRLEQAEARRRSDERTRRRLAEAEAEAQVLALTPAGPPQAAWRLEPAPRALALPRFDAAAPAPESGGWPEAVRRLRSADAGGADEALATWSELAERARNGGLRQIASLEAGRLAAERSDVGSAQRLLTTAAQASPTLASLDGAPVRLSALRHLAALDLRVGSSAGTSRLLDATDDGSRLATGDGLGPSRILVGFADDVARGLLPGLQPSVRARLQNAVAHARRGEAAAAALPGDGVALLEGQVLWRRGAYLQVRPLSSLVAAPPDGYEPSVDALLLPATASLTETMVRLRGPLAGVVLRLRPEAAGLDGTGALLALVAGLAVYLLGAVLAVDALRRSRRTADQQADFVAAVSHELKTPIASVRAMAELLADPRDVDPERNQRYAAMIEGEMLRLGAMVHNVLDAARIERLGALPVSLRPGDPAAVVDEAVGAVRPDLERRGFDLSSEIVAARGPIPLDREALKGVLLNLLDNAAKYSPARREVRVEAGPTPDGRGYAIAVLDRGKGLDPTKHERLFRRFYRGVGARRDAVPGVGLGLHVARSVVEAHRGRLWAESREGGGAVFRIELRGDEP